MTYRINSYKLSTSVIYEHEHIIEWLKKKKNCCSFILLDNWKISALSIEDDPHVAFEQTYNQHEGTPWGSMLKRFIPMYSLK